MIEDEMCPAAAVASEIGLPEDGAKVDMFQQAATTRMILCMCAKWARARKTSEYRLQGVTQWLHTIWKKSFHQHAVGIGTWEWETTCSQGCIDLRILPDGFHSKKSRVPNPYDSLNILHGFALIRLALLESVLLCFALR